MTPLPQKPNPYAQYGFIPDSETPTPNQDEQNSNPNPNPNSTPNPYAEYGFVPDTSAQTQAQAALPSSNAPQTQQPSAQGTYSSDGDYIPSAEEAKRVAGLAVHGFSEGVGTLADIAAMAEQGNTPPTYQAKVPGQKDGSQTDQTHAQGLIADYLGKKVNDLFGTDLTPQDAFERFIHLIGEFSVPIPGLGLAGGGAKAVSAGVKGLAKGLLKHEALAAGGALGVTEAEEAGVESALGKLAAGMGGTAAVSALGTLKPQKAILTLAGFGKKRLKTDALDAAKRLGVELPGLAVTQAALPSHLHHAIAKTPYFGNKLQDSLIKAGQQYQNAFETLLNKVSPPLKEELSVIGDKLYAPLEHLAPPTDTIDPTPLLNKIKAIETKLESPGYSEKTKLLFSIFDDIKKSLKTKEQPIPKHLEELMKVAPEAIKEEIQKHLKDMEPTVKPLPVRLIKNRMTQTNQTMKDKKLFDKVEDAGVLKFLGSLQDVTRGLLEQYGQKNPAYLAALKKANETYGGYARRETLENLLGEQIKDLVTGQPNYNQLIKTLQTKKYKQVLKQSFGKENYSQLKDYVEVAKAMESIKRHNQNPSGSGYISALYSLSSGMLSAPVYTAKLLASTYGGTKLLTSKRFLNLANRYAKQPSESLAQKLETIVKQTTGQSSVSLAKELGEIRKRQEGEENPMTG